MTTSASACAFCFLLRQFIQKEISYEAKIEKVGREGVNMYMYMNFRRDLGCQLLPGLVLSRHDGTVDGSWFDIYTTSGRPPWMSYLACG